MKRILYKGHVRVLLYLYLGKILEQSDSALNELTLKVYVTGYYSPIGARFEPIVGSSVIPQQLPLLAPAFGVERGWGVEKESGLEGGE